MTDWHEELAVHLNNLIMHTSKDSAISCFEQCRSSGRYRNCCSVACKRMPDRCELFWLLTCMNVVVMIDEDDSRPPLFLDWVNCMSFLSSYCDEPPEINFYGII